MLYAEMGGDEIRPCDKEQKINQSYKAEQGPCNGRCKNPCHPLSSLRLKLNSRQPLPALVFNSLTVPKSLANNAQFEIKFVLGKGSNNSCDRVRGRHHSRRSLYNLKDR